MGNFGFDNGHGTTFEYGLRFLEFPKFEYGYEKINSIDIPGRAGTLTEHTDIYTDTMITNSLEFECKSEAEYENEESKIKRWLDQTKKITYSGSEDRYYSVKKVEYEKILRRHGTCGNITVIFTCAPKAYLYEGDIGIMISEAYSFYNAFLKSFPIFRIFGEGVCVIEVNGKSLSANVGQNLIINTELMTAYRVDGERQNTAVIGNYEDLYLQEGENVINVTRGFQVELFPKWRC